VADFLSSKKFLDEVSLYEKSTSPGDLKHLDEMLAVRAHNPQFPRRIVSFCEPSSPNNLYRSGNELIHYKETDSEEIEFLSLFWRRV